MDTLSTERLTRKGEAIRPLSYTPFQQMNGDASRQNPFRDPKQSEPDFDEAAVKS
jgi:hypothetical protein